MLVPETPYYLGSKGEWEHAAEVLRRIRKAENYILAEMKEIVAYVKSQRYNVNIRSLLQNKAARRSLILATGISCIHQGSGMLVLLSSTQAISHEADSSMNPEISAISLSSMPHFGIAVTAKLIDLPSRRTMLIVPSCGMILSTLILSLYFHIRNHNLGNYLPNWL